MRRLAGSPRKARPFGPVAWTLLVTIGAALGTALPVATFVAVTRLGLPAWVIYPSVALAGGLQGWLVGVAQALALYRTVLAVPRAGWSLITLAGALVAWSLGLLPATLDALGEPLDLAAWPIVAATILGASVLLVAVPAAQWLLLRRVLPGAWLWIVVEAVALVLAGVAWWVAGLFVDTRGASDSIAASLALGGGVAALTFALVTGFGLLMMAPRPD